MDLKTLGEKLQESHYATPSEFAKDIRLIFGNSKKFKPKRDSMIYAMTGRLSILFEEHFKNILTSYQTQMKAPRCKSKLFPINWTQNNLQFSYFAGNSDSLHSNDTESTKDKSLAPTNSSKGIQVANALEGNKEKIEIVPSWAEVKNVIPSVVALGSSKESSSDDDEEPIRYLVLVFHLISRFIFVYIFLNLRRRIPVAKANCHTSPGSGSGSPSSGIPADAFAAPHGRKAV